jgi:hypothetical protein
MKTVTLRLDGSAFHVCFASIAPGFWRLHFGREVQPALFVTDMLLCIFLGGRLMHETVLVVRLVMLDY